MGTWDTTFRAFRDIDDHFRTEFCRQLTTQELNELKASGKAHKENLDPCMERGGQAFRELAKTEKKVEVLSERMQAISLECRRKVLKIRDDLLEKLRPKARAALNQWIEGPVKSSISVTVAKRELAF